MGEDSLFFELGQAVEKLGDPIYWIAVVAAVFVAGLTGMVPGASGVLIMALSIPFIVDVFAGERATIGLVMLASMTGVNNTLDSIPAVLLGQPGAATQVTFLEGHQLARQGRAAHTLGAIYAVSALGGLVGAIVLALVIPLIKPVILSFGFPEIAAMAFFGIAMVSALSAGAMVKGIAAGAFGVLLGTVGINPITGDVRFVFQQPSLWFGLPIIAITLGFFALPEMLDLSIARRSVAPPNTVINNREVLRGAKDGLKRWPIMIRQSVFGVVLGAIPGVGAAVIDWLSYAFGIFWSKDKSQFGKGSLDGVLFAESAQNSKEAGQAIPTLALGIPGGLAWAFVLIAMIAMDFTPGPRLLGDQADFIILLVITLAIGNFIVTMLGIVATGQLAKLTLIPYPVIGGVVIPIAFLTGVINMTNWLALPIMLVFAGLGVIMKLFQWPRPPLLLGIILGPIIEKNFVSALNVHGTVGVAARPLTIALIVIAVTTAYFFYRSGRSQTQQTQDSSAPTPAGGSDTGPRVTLLQAFFAARNIPILIAVGAGLAFIASSMGFQAVEAWVLPRSMAVLAITLSMVQLFFHLRERGSSHVQIMDLGMHSLVLPGAKQAIILLTVGFLMAIVLTGVLGFRWAAIALGGYFPFALMATTRFDMTRALVISIATGVVIVALLATGAIAAIATAMIPSFVEFTAVPVGESIVTGITVAVALFVALTLTAEGMSRISKPGPVSVVALFFVTLSLILVLSGWPGETIGWLFRIPPALLLLALLFIPGVRAFQPSPALEGVFSWRVLASIITMGFVFLFEYVMADNVLFIIWPEPALFEWFGREILGNEA